MIEADKTVVVILRLEDVEILRRNSESRFRRIDQSDVVEKHRRIRRRLAAPLSFIVSKKKRLIFFEGSAERDAELVLAEDVRLRCRLQKRSRVHRVVLKIVVGRPVDVVGAGLRHDVHNAAQSAAVLGAETVVDDAELLDSLLRRRGALRTGYGIDGVGAVNRNLIAEIAHSCK